MARPIADAACPPCAEALPADLHYVDDSRPGLTRRLVRGAFAYFDVHGRPVDAPAEIARIHALAIPPAYRDVWICADPRGHLQATGRDARGRKQYRYHPRWREARDANKYERMLAFGAALPRIRARVSRDLALRGLPRDKVLATVVRLLDTTLIRVGNADYARENHSFGLTTLRNRHVKIQAGAVRFQFRGKSGVHHDVAVTDPKVARIIKRCMELPGHELFQYLDDGGERHTVDSSAINDYLRVCSGGEFTAKDYRTWAGTVFALAALRARAWDTVADARHHIVGTIKEIATRLGNTPAVCRRCYVHPAVLEYYESGRLNAESDSASVPLGRGKRGLKRDEVALTEFLKQLTREAKRVTRQVARSPAATIVGEENGRLKKLLEASAGKRAPRAGGGQDGKCV
ncbi:DNA topoisomerase IB [Robbsia sp. Bb-Pol-6]|uniref:DNA topoisomerase n=1 Tax=Robbsia betulipollinis TaxID=2981849 RepID=A0ABT3ZIR2_9BURK|nr:DNA topoisomerase IB [Robbsia betulipollinis]